MTKSVKRKTGNTGRWFLSVWIQILHSHFQPHILIITKKNKLEWTFKTRVEPNDEFKAVMEEISMRCRKWRE